MEDYKQNQEPQEAKDNEINHVDNDYMDSETRQKIEDSIKVPGWDEVSRNYENIRNSKYPNFITEVFYSLPLNESQRKELHTFIMSEYERDPEALIIKS